MNRNLFHSATKFTRLFAASGVILLICVALANYLNFETGLIGILAHFPFHCGFASLVLFFILKHSFRALASVAFLLGLGFLIQVGLLWLPDFQTSTASEYPPLRILSFNVYRDNQQYSEVLAALQKKNADIIYLTEMSPEWFIEIAPLEKHYPYRLASGENLLLSKYPLEKSRAVSTSFDETQVANRAMGSPLTLSDQLRQHWWNTGLLIASVDLGSRRLSLGGIHSPTPRSDLSHLIQKACGLVAFHEMSKDSRSNASVIVGDLNTTRFSPTFRFILQHTSLQDSARGYGYSPTWGPRLPSEPWLPWIGAGIDHILASENVRILKRETGPAVGSDHRWVYAEIDW